MKQDVAKLIEMVHFISMKIFETKFFEISFRSRENFDRFVIEKDRNKFRKISIVDPTIKIFQNLFRSLGQRSKFFEIILKNFDRCRNFDANFEVQNDRNWSKFFRKILKWSISFRILFRFENRPKWNPDRSFATSWYKLDLHITVQVLRVQNGFLTS